jgi:enamine deaminase RidA (YjgF/YER057c/UK114 family)
MAALSPITPSTVYVPPSFSYSQAVRMGDLIFVAGQAATSEPSLLSFSYDR